MHQLLRVALQQEIHCFKSSLTSACHSNTVGEGWPAQHLFEPTWSFDTDGMISAGCSQDTKSCSSLKLLCSE
jgi:hypothetical protein